MSAREKLNPCRWCGKRNRNASDWEQRSTRPALPDDDPADILTPVGMLGPRVPCWLRLCVRCANRRLDNPYNALLNMRQVSSVSRGTVTR